MAPEIVPLGMKAAQPPADVFAFGVIAFEMLAGRRPYENMPTFLGLALAPAPSSFAALVPSLPAATALLLDRCLSREPGDRPSAAELARALVAWAEPASNVDTGGRLEAGRQRDHPRRRLPARREEDRLRAARAGARALDVAPARRR